MSLGRRRRAGVAVVQGQEAAADAELEDKGGCGGGERWECYVENVIVEKTKWNVMMVGDGKDATIVSGGLNFVDGTPTFKTATFAVVGQGFIARDMGFHNTAGAAKHQAVALMSTADHSVFYRCTMDAYQDTLYAHSNRQFYSNGSLIDPTVGSRGRHICPDTIFYAEFQNLGPGSVTKNRVKWRGLKLNLSAAQVKKFTVGPFINGDKWIPATGVSYKSGL
ncbi:putative pectinesterase/pectinesterase inhibitor 46 [Sesamum alatum]|uniref:Pectinesterase/pectinesterase inhibitor 46 n=1 Tax=Sesamum alatum TaxID=300844 RepID=A0AAE2CRJ9_9LAMI|nr:putative pectinesterase/pectinesterase inhibitor 46 [Sesamum alatum]